MTDALKSASASNPQLKHLNNSPLRLFLCLNSQELQIKVLVVQKKLNDSIFYNKVNFMANPLIENFFDSLFNKGDESKDKETPYLSEAFTGGNGSVSVQSNHASFRFYKDLMSLRESENKEPVKPKNRKKSDSIQCRCGRSISKPTHGLSVFCPCGKIYK